MVLLITASILVKSCLFFFVEHDLEEYTNGFFNILGQNFSEVLEFCTLREGGGYSYSYYGSKRVNFPVIPLELISGVCRFTHSAAGLWVPFGLVSLIQILQGLLIRSYLLRAFPIMSALCKTTIGRSHYEQSVNFLVGVFWINPISIYTCSLLSFGAEIELLIQLLLLWISVDSSRVCRALLPVVCALNVYYSPNMSISLIPASLSLFLLGNSHYSESPACSEHLDGYKAHFARFWSLFRSGCCTFSALSKVASFLASFLITFSSLHAFSFLLINDPNLKASSYIHTHILRNFTLLENKDLNPFLNVYWFLMYTAIPEFRLFFQIVLGSCLIAIASVTTISLEKVPFKALQSQLLICFVFKPNPTFLNYLVIFLFVLFDSVAIFESNTSLVASFSFVTWMITTPVAYLIRPIWIVEDLLESNQFYFLTLLGHFSILIFIGEWFKSLWNALVKSSLKPKQD